MTVDEVKALMRSSNNEQEWDANCETVKAKCNGYPSWWFQEIVVSGFMNEVMGPGSDQLKIEPLL
jgi:hypothetical protein